MLFSVEKSCIVPRVSLNLPAEVLTNICKHLVTVPPARFIDCPGADGLHELRCYNYSADIKRLRLICKDFNYAASPFLLPTIYFSAQARDLEVLALVADHPVFRNYVTELVCDCRLFEEHLATDAGAFLHEITSSSFWESTTSGMLPPGKQEIRQAFREYRRRYCQQQRCRESGVDMKYLADNFHKFPRLRHISVRGRALNACSSYHCLQKRTITSIILRPRSNESWRYDDASGPHKARCQRAMLALIETLASRDISSKIRSLTIGHRADDEELRLTDDLFSSAETAEEMCTNLMRNLKQLRLTVKFGKSPVMGFSIPGQMPEAPKIDHATWKALFKRSLSLSTGLESLHLSFRLGLRRSPERVTFQDILDRSAFPRLVELMLSGIVGVRAALLDFLDSHRGTLKRLMLINFELVDDDWTEFIDGARALDLRLDVCDLGVVEVDPRTANSPYPFHNHRHLCSKGVVAYLNGETDVHPIWVPTIADLVYGLGEGESPTDETEGAGDGGAGGT